MNLPYDKIRLNNTVYLYIYQVKLGDVLISLIDNLIKRLINEISINYINILILVKKIAIYQELLRILKKMKKT